MKFHDDLARIALRDGDTAAQFHHSAQKHANATWIFLAIAGVVWYFANWLWALIPFALAAFVAFQSISATLVAVRLERVEKKG